MSIYSVNILSIGQALKGGNVNILKRDFLGLLLIWQMFDIIVWMGGGEMTPSRRNLVPNTVNPSRQRSCNQRVRCLQLSGSRALMNLQNGLVLCYMNLIKIFSIILVGFYHNRVCKQIIKHFLKTTYYFPFYFLIFINFYTLTCKKDINILDLIFI